MIGWLAGWLGGAASVAAEALGLGKQSQQAVFQDMQMISSYVFAHPLHPLSTIPTLYCLLVF